VVKGAEAVMADLGDAPYPSRATHSAAGINPLWFVLCVAGVALVLLALALIFHRRRKDDLEVPENEDTFEEDYPHLRRHYDRDSSLGVEALAGAVAASLSDDDQNQESSSRSSDSDDEPSSSPSVFSDPEPSSSDDSSPSSFVFGGGDSGGGGASGDL
jgi:uncharacterized membrane protein YgcG